jgi:predicted lipoprotein with Yx(FWY)xxD motif
MRKGISAAAGVSVALLLLAGCSPTETPPVPDEPGAVTEEAELEVETSDLGEIVVDGEGMTVYVFDNDTQGTDRSACEDACAALWPAVITESDTPSVEGVTGTVGTIEAIEGGQQVTLNGWPLYTYTEDTAPGDVTGQAFNDVWWVVDPSGEKITDMPDSGFSY